MNHRAVFNKHDTSRNAYMLKGSFARKGYDWWWHSFTAVNKRTGAEKPFFIEFFLCNPALGGKEPVFGQLPANKANGVRPSYLMVKAGCWGEGHCQLHRFFGWDSVTVAKKAPYTVTAGDCFASETSLRGSVRVTPEEASEHPEYMCDSGEITFDLTLKKETAYNVGYGAGSFFRGIKAFEMYWHAEGMKTLYSGTVTLNGEEYTVTPETSFGYADKNWGRGFTTPWVWLSSNNMRSNITGKALTDSVFDIGGGKPKVFFVALERKLLGCIYYEGREYEFNFSKFWTGSRTAFTASETDDEVIWHVSQQTRKARMETEIRSAKKDMVLVNYESPDGKKRHNRLWNGGNGTGRILLYEKKKGGETLVDDIAVRNVGCEYGEYDK